MSRSHSEHSPSCFAIDGIDVGQERHCTCGLIEARLLECRKWQAKATADLIKIAKECDDLAGEVAVLRGAAPQHREVR